MNLQYNPCMWSEEAAYNFPPNTKPETEIDVIDDNAIRIDGELFEFPPDGIACPDIREQTGGVIEEAHRDANGVLCLTVRRFFTQPGVELDWYTEDYVDVTPSYEPRSIDAIQIAMLTQADIDAIDAKKLKEKRIAEIQKEIDSLEYRQGRPIRAISLGTATKEDYEKLEELEALAVDLRKELRELIPDYIVRY